MKLVILFIIIIVEFLLFLKFFMKKWYVIFAIKYVYIPDFMSSKNEFINDQPLKLLKARHNNIITLYILVAILMFIFFYGTISFYITLLSFISYSQSGCIL